MKSKSVNVRVSAKTAWMLRQMADVQGRSQADLLNDAVRSLFLSHAAQEGQPDQGQEWLEADLDHALPAKP